jgi:hypothetical protein
VHQESQRGRSAKLSSQNPKFWTISGKSQNHTDEKENEIFLIHKELQIRTVAKSYMRKGFLIYEEMRKYLTIYEEVVRYTVYDFATDPV